MEVVNHIVRYDAYCCKCDHYEKEGWEDPCHDCLQTPTNKHSRKPIHFKEREKIRDKNKGYSREKS